MAQRSSRSIRAEKVRVIRSSQAHNLVSFSDSRLPQSSSTNSAPYLSTWCASLHSLDIALMAAGTPVSHTAFDSYLIPITQKLRSASV